jgi:probable addiction module antidote protein
MPKRTKNYETGLHERLRDPAYTMEYLRVALEDHDEHSDAVFLLALRDVAQANRMAYVAEATGLNRESLYKMLSSKGNPGINSLKAVLNAVGLRLSVEVAANVRHSATVTVTWSPEVVCEEEVPDRQDAHVMSTSQEPIITQARVPLPPGTHGTVPPSQLTGGKSKDSASLLSQALVVSIPRNFRVDINVRGDELRREDLTKIKNQFNRWIEGLEEAFEE